MGTMVIHITMIIITVTLILTFLFIITDIRIIMAIIMIEADDQGVSMKRTEMKVKRKELWLH